MISAQTIDKASQSKIRILLILILIVVAYLALQALVQQCIATNNFCKQTTQIRNDFLASSIVVYILLPLCFWHLRLQNHLGPKIITIRQPFSKFSRVILLLWATFQIVMGVGYTIVNPHDSIALIVLYAATTIGWGLILLYFGFLKISINKNGIWNQFYFLSWESIKSYEWRNSKLPKNSKLIIKNNYGTHTIYLVSKQKDTIDKILVAYLS